MNLQFPSEGELFTGIIEASAQIIGISQGKESLQIRVAKPKDFDDLNIGDSVACNGVCLTVEKFDDQEVWFTIGHETLQVTGWDIATLEGRFLNLERSLRFGDRIHGHLVSGHVDTTTTVAQKEWAGDCLILTFVTPKDQSRHIWTKCSVTINGVSLTVNDVSSGCFQVCLIPETLRKTNLNQLEVNQRVNIETDYYMKGLLSSQGDANAYSP